MFRLCLSVVFVSSASLVREVMASTGAEGEVETRNSAKISAAEQEKCSPAMLDDEDNLIFTERGFMQNKKKIPTGLMAQSLSEFRGFEGMDDELDKAGLW